MPKLWRRWTILKPARIDRSMTKPLDAQASPQMMRVWDPLVRIFHWSLVLSFAAAWFTSESRDSLHQRAGYAAAALILLRLVWVFMRTPYARFSQFTHRPQPVVSAMLAILPVSTEQHMSHNPDATTQ